MNRMTPHNSASSSDADAFAGSAEREAPAAPYRPIQAPGDFATTRWSVALAAGRGDEADRRRAFGELFQIYWEPLYGYLRRSGSSPDEAEEVVQGFFARLLEKGDLAQAAPEKGKFRSFLLASVRHYLSNERDRARAAKRGGGRLLSLDVATAERRYAAEPADRNTPDELFDRAWALTSIERARARLRAEAVEGGNERRFDRLEPFLAGDADDRYRDAAEELGLTEGAVKATVARLRKRFGDLLRQEIAPTVERVEEIDEELRDLLAALRR